jgi:hypothetical protein
LLFVLFIGVTPSLVLVCSTWTICKTDLDCTAIGMWPKNYSTHLLGLTLGRLRVSTQNARRRAKPIRRNDYQKCEADYLLDLFGLGKGGKTKTSGG